MEHNEIKRIMRHRYPMLLIDKITAVEKWDKVTGVKCITASDVCFAQVPEYAPLSSYAYPPALIIESFGQACGFLIALKQEVVQSQAGNLMVAAGVMGISFHRNVYPGETLVLNGRLVRELGEFAVFDGEAMCENQTVATVKSLIVAFVAPTAIALA